MGKSVELKITEWILSTLFDTFIQPWMENYESVSDSADCSTAYYKTAVYRLRRQGLVKLAEKNGQRFLEITKKGQLKALVIKAVRRSEAKWDGKWRLIVFDIPEKARIQRRQLRQLLKNNGFYKLQASVFICPYPLNREAISYLKETGLIEFIRILKVEEVDYDKDLKRIFALK